MDAAQRERDKARACVLFWGDRTDAVAFRRYLLNPALKSFGASRMQDTCVLWTGEDYDTARRPLLVAGPAADGEGAPDGCGASGFEGEPDIVCFPPPGLFPREMLGGHVPMWTIMPDSRLYQPTQQMQVRMWRVRLSSDEGGAVRAAERVEEVPIELLSCDCSSKGNPFCVLFRPALMHIVDGDQFEVELSGLRGLESRRHFFHEFTSFGADRTDYHLLEAAESIRGLLDDPALWVSPSSLVGGTSVSPGQMQDTKGQRSGRHHAKALAAAAAGSEEAVTHVEIGLVTHPSRVITTETVELLIGLWCPDATAIRAHLALARVAGNEEVRRGAMVLKVREHFLVRVKLPMASCRYELSFFVASRRRPETMVEHPLKYCIISADTCPNLLISMEHPLRDKFGYALQLPAAHALGVSVLAPLDHRIPTGYAYFLLHVDPEPSGVEVAVESPDGSQVGADLMAAAAAALSARRETGSEAARPAQRGTVLFQERMAAGIALRDSSEDQQGRRAGSKSVSGGDHDRPTGGGEKPERGPRGTPKVKRRKETPEDLRPVGLVGMLHTALAEKLEAGVQDCQGSAHVDVSLLEPSGRQRYVLRLRQREDIPELHDGLLLFSEQDVGGRVETHVYFPKVQGCPPMKIAEWLIVKKEEHFPAGF